MKIALYPGDGIGPEVIEQAVRVLKVVTESHPAVRLDFTELPWGVNWYEDHARVVPEDFLETLRGFDAILLGACGWPTRLPDHVTLAPLVQIRQAFDQYACLRPVRLWPGVPSVLSSKGPDDIDFVVLRENSEGEYVDCGSRVHVGQPDEVALQTSVHSRRGVERILRFGFDLARTRRKRLTMITKSNAMRFAYGLWDELLIELQDQYADVESNRMHVDAAAMDFVRRPETFDVVVASNLFGDLLTDLGGIISGGLGLAPSCNLNPEREYPSMFEPVHGSAPDIAGQGIANPVAAILSAGMMLEWLGHAEAAREIETAVKRALSEDRGTPDLGGNLTTAEMGSAVIDCLE